MIVDLLHHTLVAFLAIGWPIWDYYETRKLKEAKHPNVKTRSYQKNVAILWLITIILLLTVSISQLFTPILFPEVISLLGETGKVSLSSVLFGVLVSAGLFFVVSRKNPGVCEHLAKPLKALSFFLPNTKHERYWFAALSITAGICEEIIFRGFLIRYFDGFPIALGGIGSILAAAVVFGILHGYQGIGGMISTTFLALIFTALFYMSGSLWLPIILHALFDLRILLIWKPETPSHISENSST